LRGARQDDEANNADAVRVSPARGPRGEFGARGAVDVRAPAEAVWRLMTAVEALPSWSPGVKATRVLSRESPRVVFLRQTARWQFLALRGDFSVDLRMEQDEAARTITTRLLRAGDGAHDHGGHGLGAGGGNGSGGKGRAAGALWGGGSGALSAGGAAAAATGRGGGGGGGGGMMRHFGTSMRIVELGGGRAGDGSGGGGSGSGSGGEASSLSASASSSQPPGFLSLLAQAFAAGAGGVGPWPGQAPASPFAAAGSLQSNAGMLGVGGDGGGVGSVRRAVGRQKQPPPPLPLPSQQHQPQQQQQQQQQQQPSCRMEMELYMQPCVFVPPGVSALVCAQVRRQLRGLLQQVKLELEDGGSQGSGALASRRRRDEHEALAAAAGRAAAAAALSGGGGGGDLFASALPLLASPFLALPPAVKAQA